MMANFLPIAYLDTFDLAASLQRRLGLFAVSGRTGQRMLRIRTNRRGTTEAEENFGSTAAAQKWPELRIMLSRLARLGEPQGGIEYGLVFFEMLDAGAKLDWLAAHEEAPAYAQRYARLHLPVRTNPLALVVCGAEALHLAQGWATIVAHLPIAAINLGDYPRVHLVCDFRKKDVPDLADETK